MKNPILATAVVVGLSPWSALAETGHKLADGTPLTKDLVALDGCVAKVSEDGSRTISVVVDDVLYKIELVIADDKKNFVAHLYALRMGDGVDIHGIRDNVNFEDVVSDEPKQEAQAQIPSIIGKQCNRDSTPGSSVPDAGGGSEPEQSGLLLS